MVVELLAQAGVRVDDVVVGGGGAFAWFVALTRDGVAALGDKDWRAVGRAAGARSVFWVRARANDAALWCRLIATALAMPVRVCDDPGDMTARVSVALHPTRALTRAPPRTDRAQPCSPLWRRARRRLGVRRAGSGSPAAASLGGRARKGTSAIVRASCASSCEAACLHLYCGSFLKFFNLKMVGTSEKLRKKVFVHKAKRTSTARGRLAT